jgi:hypothetical protein
MLNDFIFYIFFYIAHLSFFRLKRPSSPSTSDYASLCCCPNARRPVKGRRRKSDLDQSGRSSGKEAKRLADIFLKRKT